MKRRECMLGLCALVAGAAFGQARTSPSSEEDRADDRVGRRYWVRPAIDSTSVDFYAERELRTRRPAYAKTSLRVVDIEVVDRAAGKQIVYRVRFEDDAEAFIEAADFERRLYRELSPNQVMTAPPDSAVGATPQIWTFRRSSIFATDPDVIWERIRNEGPRTFKPARPRREKDESKPAPKSQKP